LSYFRIVDNSTRLAAPDALVHEKAPDNDWTAINASITGEPTPFGKRAEVESSGMKLAAAGDAEAGAGLMEKTRTIQDAGLAAYCIAGGADGTHKIVHLIGEGGVPVGIKIVLNEGETARYRSIGLKHLSIV
jgi:hypothetical protein